MVPDFEGGDAAHHQGKYKHLAATIVWTPIPVLSWFLPLFGHLGIVTSTGVLRDFAGPYHVSVDDMAFGKPAKYLAIDLQKVSGGPQSLDNAIGEASEIYKKRMHNLFCDNCHDFVAMVLNQVGYNGGGYNTLKIAILMFFFGRYIDFSAFVKTWLPSAVIFCIIIVLVEIY